VFKNNIAVMAPAQVQNLSRTHTDILHLQLTSSLRQPRGNHMFTLFITSF